MHQDSTEATVTPEQRCGYCGQADVRLDQDDHCERCVVGAERVAAGVLFAMEEVVKEWLERDLPPEQLREAVAMSLTNAEGPLCGTVLARRPVETRERGVWSTPPSAFTEEGPREPNEIGDLRRCCGWTLEELAASLEVSPSELALWEQGAIPPRSCALAMSDVFGVSVVFLLGLSSDPQVCARCERPGCDGREEYDDEGWSVAGGTEFVCGHCLIPGDLDWPSDDEAAA